MSVKRINAGPRMSSAVVHGDTVYLAGLTADDAKADVKGQTEQILDKIDKFLKEAGTDKSKILSANIWLTDIGTWGQMNEVWDAWVAPGNTPARATVEAKLANPALKVEIMIRRPSSGIDTRERGPAIASPFAFKRTARLKARWSALLGGHLCALEGRHHVTREPAQLLLELLGRQSLGPVDHEILEPGYLASIDLIPSMTSAGGPQNQAFCLTPSRIDGMRAGAPGVPQVRPCSSA